MELKFCVVLISIFYCLIVEHSKPIIMSFRFSYNSLSYTKIAPKSLFTSRLLVSQLKDLIATMDSTNPKIFYESFRISRFWYHLIVPFKGGKMVFTKITKIRLPRKSFFLPCHPSAILWKFAPQVMKFAKVMPI
jgi:hypothetical protein